MFSRKELGYTSQVNIKDAGDGAIKVVARLLQVSFLEFSSIYNLKHAKYTPYT